MINGLDGLVRMFLSTMGSDWNVVMALEVYFRGVYLRCISYIRGVY